MNLPETCGFNFSSRDPAKDTFSLIARIIANKILFPVPHMDVRSLVNPKDLGQKKKDLAETSKSRPGSGV